MTDNLLASFECKSKLRVEKKGTETTCKTKNPPLIECPRKKKVSEDFGSVSLNFKKNKDDTCSLKGFTIKLKTENQREALEGVQKILQSIL